MTEIVIAEAVRSAVGRGHKGSLSTKRPDELAADVIRGLMARVPQFKGKIDDVVLGCAMPEGEQGLNVARLIALLADLGPEVPAQTINRFCSSGLQAIAIAAGSIAVGSNDVVIAGGVESMTYVPMTGFHLSAETPSVVAVLSRARHSSTVIFRRTRLRTRAISATSLTGLERKSSAPASSPRTRSVASVSAVTITTGICAVGGLDLMRLHTSNPSMPGIITSSKTISGMSFTTRSSACGPDVAVMTS